MRIGIQTWGSHGDMVPFFALAGGLSRDGHDVTLAVTTDERADYSALAAKLDIELVRVGSGFVEPPLEELQQIVRTRDRVEEVRLLNEHFFDPVTEELYEASVALCSDSDIVIGHFWLHPLLTAATVHAVPRVVVQLCPIGVRTRYRPALGPNLGPWINGLVWDLGDYWMRKRLFRKAEALRIAAGLPPIESLQKELFVSEDLTLIAASPLLCPRPADWSDAIRVCGFLAPSLHAPAAAMPNGLSAFLEAGPPPILFTFGSCEIFYAERNVELFLETMNLLGGERAVVQSSYREALGDYDRSRVFVVSDRIDHTQVFPRCALVVHHGGAGTTQTALRSGKPAIVVEHGFDQSYWGKALVDASVSPRLLHRRSVTPRKLARAIETGLSAELAREARRLGGLLGQEDGVATAVELIDRRFAKLE